MKEVSIMKVVLTMREKRNIRVFIRRAKKTAKVVLVAGLFTVAFAICGNVESKYKIEAEITDLQGYTYTAVDVAGYEWKFEDDTLFPVGTKVKLKMFNHCTDNSRADDEIVKVKPVR